MASNSDRGLVAPSVDGSALVDEPGRTEGMTVARATDPVPIWKRRSELDRVNRMARTEATREIMSDYYDKLRALYADCAAEGHVKGKFWNNGLGCSWFYCSKCGARMEDTIEPKPVATPTPVSADARSHEAPTRTAEE